MSFLDQYKTPEEWAGVLRERGANFSARRLRTRARELGQFVGHNKAMLLNENHINTIMVTEASRRPPSVDTEPNRDGTE